MTDARAKRWVLLALFVTVGAGTVQSLAQDGRLPSVRLPLGALVVTVLLSIAAEVSPALAGAFAALIVVTVLLTVVPWPDVARLTS